MGKVVKAVFAVAAVVAAVVLTGGTALGAVASTIGRALVTAAVSIGISRLVAKRATTAADAGNDGGARFQLQPSTSNKLPIVYGTAFVGGAITDAMISSDQLTMWYVIAFAEVSDNQGGGGGSYTYDTSKIYYDGKLVQFGTNGAVTGLITNTTPAQTDTRCNGFLDIYLFTNGSSSGINTGGQTAAQILSTTNGVPAARAWGASQTMTNCAFAIVKVKFSRDAGTTGSGELMVNISNSITKPGDAILDYMLNNRYGCALPIESIDTASLTALNTYSDELIDYIPANGNTTPPLPQQARYRINGPLYTGQSCLNNLQFLVDSCDSWLQYSELTGKWKVVINKLYDGYPTVSGLYAVNSSNLIGGIEVSPIDLNETYNQIEVAYPNTNIKDQTDYYIIDLFDTDPQLLSPNEAINRLNLTLPLINNAVQARYLAARRIYQSREDLVIAFRLDYSGIQLEAGDVIRVTHEVYGWTDKLFRVNTVAETKDQNGNLFADVQAFEYSDAIYADVVQDYIPAFNTGLKDPNVISPPCPPSITTFTDSNALVTGFNVQSCVPEEGLVLYMDFNYGNSSNVLQHRLYRTVQQSNGVPFTNSPDIANANVTTVTIPVNDLAAGNYYWSVTARNDTSGRRSNGSNLFSWAGANIQPYDPNTGNGGITGNQVQSNTIGFSNLSNNFISTQAIGAYNWTVGNSIANTINMPANIANIGNISTGNFQQPLYITNVYSGGGGLYPFYDGTSSIVDYYQANSTSSFNPIGADQLALVNGDLNWWVAAYRTATSNVDPGYYIRVEYNSQIVSDTDTTIQMIPFTRSNVTPANTFLADTETLYTYDLYAGLPYRVNFAASYTSTNKLIAGGVVMRLLSTANVVMVNGSFGLSRGKT